MQSTLPHKFVIDISSIPYKEAPLIIKQQLDYVKEHGFQTVSKFFEKLSFGDLQTLVYLTNDVMNYSKTKNTTVPYALLFSLVLILLHGEGEVHSSVEEMHNCIAHFAEYLLIEGEIRLNSPNEVKNIDRTKYTLIK